MIDLFQLTDKEILIEASQGDQEAFGMLYERYVGKIFNYVYYRTGNPHDAENKTATEFNRAKRHIENYLSRPGCTGSLTTWWQTGTGITAARKRSRWMMPSPLEKAETILKQLS